MEAYLVDLGKADYRDAHQLQVDCDQWRLLEKGRPGIFIVNEHQFVFTLGKRGSRESLTVGEEFIKIMGDLQDNRCDILTLGQYLQPSRSHLPVERFVPPEEFDSLNLLSINGLVTHEGVAEAFDLEYTSVEEVLVAGLPMQAQ